MDEVLLCFASRYEMGRLYRWAKAESRSHIHGFIVGCRASELDEIPEGMHMIFICGWSGGREDLTLGGVYDVSRVLYNK